MIFWCRFSCISSDVHKFGNMGPQDSKTRPAALVETFTRFQAGLLSFEDCHRILFCFLWFPWTVQDSHALLGMGAWIRPAAAMENFAQFHASSLASEDFHCIAQFFIDFSGFDYFSWISEHGCLRPWHASWAPTCFPKKPMLDSKLASWSLRTCIVFHRFSKIFADSHYFEFQLFFVNCHGFRSMGASGPGMTVKVQPAALIKTFARFQAVFLASEGFQRIL